MWELFHQALERPKEERHTFSNAHCGDDPDLGRQVGELLSAHGSPSPLSADGGATRCLIDDHIESFLGGGGAGDGRRDRRAAPRARRRG